MSNEYITPIQHKFAVGDKVRVIAPFSKLYLYSGEIAALMPYTLSRPAYDVRIGDEIVPFSERSLEKIERKEGETG